MGGKNKTSQTRILSYEAVKGRQSTTIPSQSGNSEAASSDNWLESNSSPYILTFTSPSSRKRDLQLVFPMPAIGNSANDDFVTHRGQIQVVIMDWNWRLNFVGLTWPQYYDVVLNRNYSVAFGSFWPVSLCRWHTVSEEQQLQNGKHFWQFPLSFSISHLTVSYINFSIAKLPKARLTAHQKLSSKWSLLASIDII